MASLEEFKNIIKSAKGINAEVKKIISSKHDFITNPSKVDKEFLRRVDNELNQGIKYIEKTISGNLDTIYAIDIFLNASITANQLKEHDKSNIGKNGEFIKLCSFLDKLYGKILKHA